MKTEAHLEKKWERREQKRWERGYDPFFDEEEGPRVKTVAVNPERFHGRTADFFIFDEFVGEVVKTTGRTEGKAKAGWSRRQEKRDRMKGYRHAKSITQEMRDAWAAEEARLNAHRNKLGFGEF